jgi:hypothetical protein
MYYLKKNYIEETGETVDCIKKVEDGITIHIPTISGNRHYREYLEWLAEGNTPEPAEESVNE